MISIIGRSVFSFNFIKPILGLNSEPSNLINCDFNDNLGTIIYNIDIYNLDIYDV